jgi:hypothetical protein
VETYGKARRVTDDNTTQRMRLVCWITKATDTLSEHIILITFPRRQWLWERASMVYLLSVLLPPAIAGGASVTMHVSL